MSIKIFEEFSPDKDICALRDKAFNYVSNRAVKAFDKAAEIRSGVKSQADLKKYKDNNKKVLKKSVGSIPYDNTLPLNARITGTIEEDDLVIEKLVFQSLKNVYVTANMYIPKGKGEKLPAVLFLCGHSANGKANESYQIAARIISRAGIAVLMTEPEGQGERMGYIDSAENGPDICGAVANHQQFGHQCFLNGESSVKYFVADAMRAVDYLQSREDIDPERIGLTGNSGGGTMTSLVAAIDKRIQAAAPGCWPTSGKEYFFIGTSPDAEQIWPGVFESNFDHYELMSLICPRPLMLLTAAYDFVPIEGSKKLYKECLRLWEIAESGDNIEIATSPDTHGYSKYLAVEAAKFFQKHLGTPLCEVTDEHVNFLEDEKLNVTKSGFTKFDFGSEFTFDKNLEEYNKNNYSAVPLDVRRRELYQKIYKGRDISFEINVRRFGEDTAEGLCGRYYMWYSQHLMPNYAVMICSEENKDKVTPVTICLWNGGTDKIAENANKIKEICAGGSAALVLDLTASGKCAPNPLLSFNGDYRIVDKISKSLIQLGDSLCALQAYDTMQAIKVLREQLNADKISIYAKEEYAIIARICEMIDSEITVSTDNEITVKSIITNRLYKYDNTSHILMMGLGKLIE